MLTEASHSDKNSNRLVVGTRLPLAIDTYACVENFAIINIVDASRDKMWHPSCITYGDLTA